MKLEVSIYVPNKGGIYFDPCKQMYKYSSKLYTSYIIFYKVVSVQTLFPKICTN